MPSASDPCERHLDAGRRALSLGDLTAAESELHAALVTAENGSEDQLAAALAAYAQLLYQTRRFAEAVPYFQRALFVRERAVGPMDPSLIPGLHNLAAVQLAAGDMAAAEPLLRRALAMLEAAHGPEGLELAGVLNGLSQLYLKRGAHADAEPLLRRLLVIRRAEGEDRAEVATVMASLASVLHAVAEHEEAERLLRRVLEIRERTLAPNHFAIATSLEALAETCATRGKLDEALRLLQRALEVRERTLGVTHASLGVVRSKIADLQLQLSQDAFAVPLMETRADARSVAPARLAASVAAPAEHPLTEFSIGRNAGAHPALIAEDTNARLNAMRSIAAELESQHNGPALADREGESSLAISILPTGSALVLPGNERAGGARMPLEDDELDFGDEAAQRDLAELFGRPRVWIAAAAVTLVLTVASVVAIQSANGETSQSLAAQTVSGEPAERLTATGSVEQSPAIVPVPSTPSDSTAQAPEREGPRGAGPRAPTRPATMPEPREPQTRAQEIAGTAFPASASQAGSSPSAPSAVQPRVDLRVTAQAPSIDFTTAGRGDTSSPLSQARRRQTSDVYGAEASYRPPALIGNVPVPRYSADLRRDRVRGDLVVAFAVDTMGRVNPGSLRVVRSDDTRFLAPVAELLPRLRFIPAERQGRKVEQVVEMLFRYTPDQD